MFTLGKFSTKLVTSPGQSDTLEFPPPRTDRKPGVESVNNLKLRLMEPDAQRADNKFREQMESHIKHLNLPEA